VEITRAKGGRGLRRESSQTGQIAEDFLARSCDMPSVAATVALRKISNLLGRVVTTPAERTQYTATRRLRFDRVLIDDFVIDKEPAGLTLISDGEIGEVTHPRSTWR